MTESLQVGFQVILRLWFIVQWETTILSLRNTALDKQ